MVLVPQGQPSGDSAAILTLSCGTDNQGNSFLLDKLLTTRYPLGIVLMQLAHQIRRRRLVLRARWLPRLQNQEADDLTNFEIRHFDPKRRIQVDLDKLGLDLMHELFKVGDDYLSDLEKLRELGRAKGAEAKAKGGRLAGKKGKKPRGLKETDPW